MYKFKTITISLDLFTRFFFFFTLDLVEKLENVICFRYLLLYNVVLWFNDWNFKRRYNYIIFLTVLDSQNH